MKSSVPSRRNFLRRLALAGAGSSVFMQSFAAEGGRRKKKTEKSSSPLSPEVLKGKNVLVTWGGWAGHEPEQCVNRFIPWLQENGANVMVYNSLDPYTDKELMDKTDLIIQCFTMATITKEQEKGLLEAVRAGAGLTGWHGGLCDSFRNNVAYQYATGGQWVAHPGGVIPYKVNITDHEDPVTAGIKDFKMKSEQYFMHVDPNLNVLATTTFSGDHNDWIEECIIPVVWKKSYGKGRIFYSSLGHVEKDFDVPEVTEIMKRGILWAVQSKYIGPEEWVSPVYKE